MRLDGVAVRRVLEEMSTQENDWISLNFIPNWIDSLFLILNNCVRCSSCSRLLWLFHFLFLFFFLLFPFFFRFFRFSSKCFHYFFHSSSFLIFFASASSTRLRILLNWKSNICEYFLLELLSLLFYQSLNDKKWIWKRSPIIDIKFQLG